MQIHLVHLQGQMSPPMTAGHRVGIVERAQAELGVRSSCHMLQATRWGRSCWLGTCYRRALLSAVP